MSILRRKLKRLKIIPRDFNKSHFDGISNRVDAKTKEVASVRLSVLNAPSDHRLIELEISISLELYDLMIAEESYYKQKSKLAWIQEGDQNTRFFQKVVAA